ncbi:MAG: IS200/IS605 family transposase [Acidobacteria bacterium]|nr:MAG: IS200/IS605 family transposase [Acidobacteriota bacterium]REK02848.1 MAG: IS200/IS605 family transposase [Acidobacteriota bacterium]REK13348.1 MAG: IS200/IS605 family transposase [Acidobacteriota bacterium]REK41342.1 MAG: IS200/IS605 family transposase [Acidobacteriota bacterium]
MPSTHLVLQYHVVFSTKERRPFIKKEWRQRFHKLISGCIRAKGGTPLAIGGVSDHVHLLVGLRSTHQLANFVKAVKVSSSKWVHRDIGLEVFSWQIGYGAFTVSPSQTTIVRKYIEGQERHHSKISFKDEYLRLLKKSGAKFDEEYLW